MHESCDKFAKIVKARAVILQNDRRQPDNVSVFQDKLQKC